MKIVILDRATLGFDIGMDIFDSLGEVISYDITLANETISRVKDADIIITNKVLVTKEIMNEASNLKLICISATGTNNVDLEYAKQMTDSIDNDGLIVSLPNGNGVISTRINPALTIYESCLRNIHQCSAKLGISRNDRIKLKLLEEKKSDEFDNDFN